ncbi:putative mitochondrial protein AtMg00820 [Bidens hawaiensis]|uniref:putative mitochondrial protein AtMg00820 n=1 Tax=Bidens hawaiensis TaxID=980011 RepID=UPI004049CE1A
MEPTSVRMALEDSSWVEALQEELKQFIRLGVWYIIDKHILTKWVFKCKKDDHGVNVRDKAHLVMQGFHRQEGIGYTEVYAPIVLVKKPPGLEDPDYPDRVYRLNNAIYGQPQAPRALYGTLANHLTVSSEPPSDSSGGGEVYISLSEG